MVSVVNGPPAQAAVSAREMCRTVRVPVAIPEVAQPGEISGRYCVPHHSNGTILLLVGGGAENADYWSMPGLPAANSLVDAAARDGFATYAIDRLGTGQSTIPAQSTTVTYTAEVSTEDQVARALRRGRLFGHAWRRVAGIGHSLGSGNLTGVAADYPGDVDPLVLTGYGPAVTPETLQLDKLYQVPASTVSARWANLDPGYITVEPADIAVAGSFYAPGTTSAALAAAASREGILSTTELATRPQGDAAAAQGAKIDIPVLIADGEFDRHYCLINPVGQPDMVGAQCGTPGAFQGYEDSLLPNACLSTAVIAGSGHAIQEEIAAGAADALILAWLTNALSGDRVHCAATGPQA
jgi:pimeloyl-ACP methyl ester carboxylesterase